MATFWLPDFGLMNFSECHRFKMTNEVKRLKYVVEILLRIQLQGYLKFNL